jgi:hypothetical protein
MANDCVLDVFILFISFFLFFFFFFFFFFFNQAKYSLASLDFAVHLDNVL